MAAVQTLESAESSSSTPHSLPTPSSQKRVSAPPVQMCIPGPGRLSLVVASGSSLLWSMGFSLHWLLLLQSTRSRCMASSFWYMGLDALQHVESSWTRDQTLVPCIGRWILYHWTTREVLHVNFILVDMQVISLKKKKKRFYCPLRLKAIWSLN